MSPMPHPFVAETSQMRGAALHPRPLGAPEALHPRPLAAHLCPCIRAFSTHSSGQLRRCPQSLRGSREHRAQPRDERRSMGSEVVSSDLDDAPPGRREVAPPAEVVLPAPSLGAMSVPEVLEGDPRLGVGEIGMHHPPRRQPHGRVRQRLGEAGIDDPEPGGSPSGIPRPRGSSAARWRASVRLAAGPSTRRHPPTHRGLRGRARAPSPGVGP
jgi:hypothetical protein